MNRPRTPTRILFGDSPIAKALDFLIDNQEFDYSLTDISKGAEIAWSTLHELFPALIKLGVVIKTRKIGRAELYKLNKENPLVKKLLEIDMLVSKQLIQREIEQQKIVA